MDLRGYSAFLPAGILFVFSACSVFKPASTIRPALAASACKPPIVAQNNQAGMALYNERRFEDARAKFLETVKDGPNCAEAHHNLGLALSYLGVNEDAGEALL